ncbi:MAG: PhzF family phenazine biosynthesis protein [Candidatus Eisenbacteria bacterium]|uniref:PhzF family phenazine biosynthesis protein n=1 Tax=Eiseniibacteriota bacterium TaxID=2212470 RepID=A0A538U9Y8_UNCEI|nr:MAG: PhzF family phenazine biosynthesis protein [Candidatus Eisenbacteria bacterium]
MKLPIYQVDAFTGTVFKGNPAAICPLERWLPEATMQSIAAENNLAETAFFVPRANGGADGADYDLRWFTPEVEMDLCGHATLASAFLVFTQLEPKRGAVTFHTRSGPLTVSRDGERLKMDFPSRPPAPCEAPAGLAEALGGAPREVLQSRDLLAVFGAETEVRALEPSFDRIRALGVHAVIATAPGSGEVDFVSRFFAPSVGVPEDPVTGSAHCTLVPYWAKRLGKKALRARQVSARGGDLLCEDLGERVTMAGQAVKYLEGTIEV